MAVAVAVAAATAAGALPPPVFPSLSNDSRGPRLSSRRVRLYQRPFPPTPLSPDLRASRRPCGRWRRNPPRLTIVEKRPRLSPRQERFEHYVWSPSARPSACPSPFSAHPPPCLAREGGEGEAIEIVPVTETTDQPLIRSRYWSKRSTIDGSGRRCGGIRMCMDIHTGVPFHFSSQLTVQFTWIGTCDLGNGRLAPALRSVRRIRYTTRIVARFRVPFSKGSSLLDKE